MKKLALRLLLFVPILLLVVIINFLIDPANLYRGQKYEQDIAEILLNGKNVTNVADFDQIVLQKFYIEGLKEPKDIIILGSSKYSAIDSSFCKNQTLMNHSMPGSSVDDYLLIYWFYKKKNLLPKKVVLGLDAWLINKNSGSEPYLSLPLDYLAMTNTLEIPNSLQNKFSLYPRSVNKYFQLFSPSYFQSSVKKIKSGTNLKNYLETTNEFENENVKVSDGSVRFNKAVRDRNKDQINMQAKAYVSKENDVVDNIQKSKFEKFIDILRNDRVEVTLVISPYQPKSYDMLINEQHLKILEISKNYFAQIAMNKNIKLVGSYNPADYNLQEEDYYDGVHIKKGALKKILDQI